MRLEIQGFGAQSGFNYKHKFAVAWVNNNEVFIGPNHQGDELYSALLGAVALYAGIMSHGTARRTGSAYCEARYAQGVAGGAAPGALMIERPGPSSPRIAEDVQRPAVRALYQ